MQTLSNCQKIVLCVEFQQCLLSYYSIVRRPCNVWRYNRACAVFLPKIMQCNYWSELPYYKGAQWGGKWGNFYRLIAVNSLNSYQFVSGFNPHKLLS